ncbi:hypothetical protein VB773_14885 [Haloarculaceae archaeon H-GB2-1]|nr:hypothetical protein [Haloarculaceae archaeon H-GB1-1]MEA5408720.1 hypothetical protein [Haloarculaceae archaeon H-GB2-1]
MTKAEFQYEGLLVFTPVSIKSKVDLSSSSSSGIGEHLPEFLQGNPDNPSEGFEEHDLHNYLKNDRFQPDSLRSLVSEITYIEYKSESYSEEEAYVDGRYKDVHIRQLETADIFILKPDLALLRGKRATVEKAISAIQRIRKADVLIEPIIFSPDFLHNLYYRSEQLFTNSKIKPREITEMRFEGPDSISTLKTHSEHINSDLQDIYQSSNEGQIEFLTRRYSVFGLNTVVQIQKDRLHVKTSKSELSGLGELETMLHSIYLCKEITEIAAELLDKNFI